VSFAILGQQESKVPLEIFLRAARRVVRISAAVLPESAFAAALREAANNNYCVGLVSLNSWTEVLQREPEVFKATLAFVQGRDTDHRDELGPLDQRLRDTLVSDAGDVRRLRDTFESVAPSDGGAVGRERQREREREVDRALSMLGCRLAKAERDRLDELMTLHGDTVGLLDALRVFGDRLHPHGVGSPNGCKPRDHDDSILPSSPNGGSPHAKSEIRSRFVDHPQYAYTSHVGSALSPGMRGRSETEEAPMWMGTPEEQLIRSKNTSSCIGAVLSGTAERGQTPKQGYVHPLRPNGDHITVNDGMMATNEEALFRERERIEKGIHRVQRSPYYADSTHSRHTEDNYGGIGKQLHRVPIRPDQSSEAICKGEGQASYYASAGLSKPKAELHRPIASKTDPRDRRNPVTWEGF
ncbi:hypothetical protein KIPB_008860, partial [Kipferlia bialata]